MARIWLIARHEYLTNIRRRSFLFVAFGIPILTIAITMLSVTLIFNKDSDPRSLGTVGYVDLAGVLHKQIDQPDYFRAYDTEAAARAALDAGSIGAYYVLPADYLKTGNVSVVAKTDIPSALGNAFDAYLRANLSSGLDAQVVKRLQDPVEASIRTLNDGRVMSENEIGGLFVTPIIFMMVFLFASQSTGSYLMSGLVEEKTNRIMEILVTSVTPFDLLFGKIIGLGLLGLTQLVVWLGGGYVTLTLSHNFSFLSAITIPPDLALVAVVYFLLGYFFMASVMACLGVIVGSEQESRQYAAIFTFGFVIPVLFITSFISDPNGPVVTFLTLFPLTSSISVLLRMSFGSLPTWQLIASMVILLLTGLFVAWASARIFRWGLLLYGKRPSLRQLIRVVRRPPSMATSATGEQNA
ncbi:MAG TPA: ABC transporter permease [Phototrophicaceae bacterium]|nr:ABC transporter permease [Phototrophicaceae bacterium]